MAHYKISSKHQPFWEVPCSKTKCLVCTLKMESTFLQNEEKKKSNKIILDTKSLDFLKDVCTGTLLVQNLLNKNCLVFYFFQFFIFSIHFGTFLTFTPLNVVLFIHVYYLYSGQLKEVLVRTFQNQRII